MKAVQALLARSPTSLLLALASLGALGAQALLGLALVRFFSPEAAGRFAVVAQIAFFWITLALAQAPLQFLADAQRPATEALRAVLRPSLARWLALAPLVSVGVWWAAPPDALQALAWAALLALLQMLWYLAQPWALLHQGCVAGAGLRRCQRDESAASAAGDPQKFHLRLGGVDDGLRHVGDRLGAVEVEAIVLQAAQGVEEMGAQFRDVIGRGHGFPCWHG